MQKGYLEEIDNLRKSNTIKVVGLDFLDNIENIKLSKEVLEFLKNIIEEYKIYIDKIKSLPNDIQILYKEAIKNEEVVSNHSLERLNPFMVSLYMLNDKETALDYLISLKRDINVYDFKRLHYILLEYTNSFQDENFRLENSKFVGKFINGERVIDYFPIDYTLIDEAVSKFLDYFNFHETNYEMAFIKPFIIHGLLAGLQIFNDGNTRFARMLEYYSFYLSTIDFIDSNINTPLLYASKTYYPYRGKYRSLIKDLVCKNDFDAWNMWFIFNMKRLEDAIMGYDYNIDELKKTL